MTRPVWYHAGIFRWRTLPDRKGRADGEMGFSKPRIASSEKSMLGGDKAESDPGVDGDFVPEGQAFVDEGNEHRVQGATLVSAQMKVECDSREEAGRIGQRGFAGLKWLARIDLTIAKARIQIRDEVVVARHGEG